MGKFFIVFFSVSVSILNPNCVTAFQEGKPQETPSLKAESYLKKLSKNYQEGHYELHKAYSDSLLSIATAHNLTKMQILAFTNQAVFYKNRSERLKAIELYHLALEKCEEIPEDFRTKIIVLVNMGNIYNDIGSYDKAIAYMEKVLELLDINEDSNKIRAAALIGLANNYLEFNDYEKTIFYAEKAKVLGEKIGNEDVIISATNNISDAYILSKDYEKALHTNSTIENITLLKKSTKKRALFLLNNGVANYHLNKLDDALSDLKACQVLSEEKQILETQMYAHEFLAKVYEQKKDYKAAVLEQNKYRTIRELYLKDKKDASNADLNQEIDTKTEIIADNIEQLEGVSKNKKNILTISGVLLVFLSAFLFYTIKRKKKLKAEQLKLQRQYRTLQKDFNNYKEESITTPIKSSNSITPYKNSSLTPEKREAYCTHILRYMKTKKPFLDPEMTQSKLSEELEISSHHFSEVLHYNMDQNFYNFMNSYRILEAQKLMRDKSKSELKILAIAFDSGFKSKSTFNRIFKSHTGITPSEYRSQLEH